MSKAIHEKVSKIVNSTDKLPTIINKESNFVVITYWWGSGKINRNTARPCTAFYEDYLKKINNYIISLINTAVAREIYKTKGPVDEDKLINTIFKNLAEYPKIFEGLYDAIGNKLVKHYINDICDYKKIDEKIPDRFAELKKNYPDFAKDITSKTPESLTYEIAGIIIKGILRNSENLRKLYKIQAEYDSSKKEYLEYKRSQEIESKNRENLKKLQQLQLLLFTRKDEDDFLKDYTTTLAGQIEPIKKTDIDLSSLASKVMKLKQDKETINKEIIDVLKKKHQQPNGTNESIFDELINLLEYQVPIKFEEMISNWEKSCRENNCNYLAVEYPEFTQEGGYQLAINAKPKFIEKALQLCSGRSVLYIDGDMNIRKYPAIFDMKNVDFMARGWWIDPRSSWKMEESIMYDPYNFETSGGTMFFSSSEESNKLINLWINAAENPINDGKADDRVLSLIFNTKGVLTWIRIIQLPVEYLWLTLDYDQRMLEYVYDYNFANMDSTIFIDHPECLTSEDTASGAGASSNRQPKFYDFLEDVYPCVETSHEYIMFKELVESYPESAKLVTDYLQSQSKQEEQKELIGKILEIDKELLTAPKSHHKELRITRNSLKNQKDVIKYLPYFYWYYHYMGGVHYIDDGNADLLDRGYVEPGNDVEENSQPLNVISYIDRFGNKKHPNSSGETVNQVADINMSSVSEIELEKYYKQNSDRFTLKDYSTHTEIIPEDYSCFTNKSMLRVILSLLLKRHVVIINPISFEGYNKELYSKIVSNIDTIYKNVDMIFNPIHSVSSRRSEFYKPEINLHQPILLKYDSRLVDFLSIQLNIEDLSIILKNGSYEFMSLIRIAYLLPKTKVKPVETLAGGNNKNITDSRIPKYNLNTTINEYLDILENPIKQIKNKNNNKKHTKKKHQEKKRKKKITHKLK